MQMRKQKDLNSLSFEGMEPWQGYLSEDKIIILNNSWAGVFRKYILPNLPVNKLSKFYSKTMGRPSKDLLVAMGVAVLQQIFNLTDQETREHLAFNQQWHFALEAFDPKEHLFSEKTLWTIRKHLTQNGVGQDIFNDVTDSLADIFKVDTINQRLDSVHVFSNMARLSRVQMMAKTNSNFLKALKRDYLHKYNTDISEELRNRYIKKKSSGYFGNVRPSESKILLSEIALDMQFLLEKYSEDEAISHINSYKIMSRVLSEQCVIKEGKVELKSTKIIPQDNVQNPSDIDSGYDGHKGHGYQAQLAETYSRKEDEQKKETLNLITYVKVESADKQDAHALQPAIDEMENRGIKPEEILADTLYGGDTNVVTAEQKGVKVIAPISGNKKGKDYSGFKFDKQTKEVLECPYGKYPISVTNNKNGAITAYWKKQNCIDCPFKKECITKNGSKKRRLHYKEKNIRLWQRRQIENSEEFREKYRYRSGIEATNSRYIHMMGARRVRYRMLKNVAFAETIKALGINLFRVLRYTRNHEKYLSFIAKTAWNSCIFSFYCLLKADFKDSIDKYLFYAKLDLNFV